MKEKVAYRLGGLALNRRGLHKHKHTPKLWLLVVLAITPLGHIMQPNQSRAYQMHMQSRGIRVSRPCITIKQYAARRRHSACDCICYQQGEGCRHGVVRTLQDCENRSPRCRTWQVTYARWKRLENVNKFILGTPHLDVGYWGIGQLECRNSELDSTLAPVICIIA